MRMFMLCLLLVAAAWSGTDYVREREQAVELAKAGQLAEAQAAFLSLGEGDATEFQRADALEQAAYLADRQERFDEALAVARRIPLPQVALATEMQLRANHRQWREIVERFGPEDLATWPDSRIGDAAFCRGRAYQALKNGEAAVRDLRLASEYLLEDNSLGLALIALGDAYWHGVGDEERALAAYRQAYLRRNVNKRAQAAMNAAAILRGRTQCAEALAELAVIPLDQLTLPYWRSRMLMAWGETLAMAGRRPEAIAKYHEALRLKGIAKQTKQACEDALRKLGEDGQ